MKVRPSSITLCIAAALAAWASPDAVPAPKPRIAADGPRLPGAVR